MKFRSMSKALLRLLQWSAVFAKASLRHWASEFRIDLTVFFDSVLNTRLNKESRNAQDYLQEHIKKVNDLLGQLVPPGYINLTAFVTTTTDQESYYMKKWADGKLRSETTLRLFIKYLYMYTQHWHADFMLYFTGLSMTADRNPKQAVEGIKQGQGVCGSMTAALVSDSGDEDKTFLTMVHELAHALGAQHDGEATTRSCPNTERHIMNPSIHGIGSTFSFCSLRDINNFLKSAQAGCLFDKPSSGRVVDPVVEKRRKEKCEEMKREEEAYYVREWYNNCKFSCLFVNSETNTATRETWVNEENGTICNKFDTSQRFHRRRNDLISVASFGKAGKLICEATPKLWARNASQVNLRDTTWLSASSLEWSRQTRKVEVVFAISV
ncbi:coagulation factor X-activating enzyme heavy chain isoform X2 [Rhipicephalus microplus]|uniref:coagulation factor X-activating enzyme heavy chain isoform X2 n=1 Tax=Rhipicephalus microplus TaxID=6941 RepID=UPI003F6AFA81